MKKGKHLLKLNNKGASLITVIITIGFIAILAGTVMMTSLVNFKMKRVNVYAKDTFYSAEQVLDEINIGLQRYISDSLSLAYMDVMQNYSQYSVEKKRNIMQTKYYENMWTKLEVGASGHRKYDVAVLESFLKTTTKWQGDDTTGYGGIVRAYETDEHGAQNLSMQGDMVTYDTGIVLKDLRVYYKDSKGFVSVIETDIRLTYPELDFAATTALPDIASHVIIADKGMVVEGVGGTLAMEGNFYADSVICEGTSQSAPKNITHSGDGRIVVKQDISLKNASFSNEKEGSLWANGITTNGADVTLLGETFMADDLNVGGDGSKITLAGIYNGFGNSLQDPDKSSAILVNGTNSTLDLLGIEKITLAGHAYVGTKREVAEGALQTSENVYTGESIAVKSNQLMYLIPAECIGVDVTTGESLYHKNPLTTAEYNAIRDKIATEPNKYSEVSLDVEVRKLDSTLTDYIVIDANGKAVPEKVFVPTNGDPLIYYYMKFKNEEAANRYFARYYNSNKATFDEYMKTYISALDFPATATVTRIKMAANGVYGDSAQNGYTMIPYTVDGTDTEIADNQLRYQQKFTALCTKLSDNYMELGQVYDDDEDPGRFVFDNLVDEDKLKAYIQAGGGTDELTKTEDFGTLLLTTKDYTEIGDSDIHLVISTGDVKVNCNFDGTIFANGTITVANNVSSVKTNSEAVSALLRYYQPMSGQNVMVAQVLRAGNDFVFALEDAESEEDATNSLADLIVYENWKKE